MVLRTGKAIPVWEVRFRRQPNCSDGSHGKEAKHGPSALWRDELRSLPLCGQNLVPAQAEQARHRLQDCATTQTTTNEFQPKLSTNNQLKGESQ
jgi:hypothetical protein